MTETEISANGGRDALVKNQRLNALIANHSASRLIGSRYKNFGATTPILIGMSWNLQLKKPHTTFRRTHDWFVFNAVFGCCRNHSGCLAVRANSVVGSRIGACTCFIYD